MSQSSDTRYGETTDEGRYARVGLVLALLLAVPAPTAMAQDAAPAERTDRPLTVREVVEFESLALRSPVRISPDGRRVAYTVAGSQRPLGSVLELVKDSARASAEMRVADLETGQIVDLTPGSSSWAPAWSPDGSTLAFYSTRSGEPLLWIWSPDGGLRSAVDAPVWPAFMDQTPRWANRRTLVVKLLPEGQSVAATARQARPWAPEPGGREGTSVQLFRAQEPDRKADALPDWIRWAYGGDLAAIDVQSGSVTRLADDQLAMWWDVSRDGSTLAFSAIAGIEDERAGFTLYPVPVAGGPVRALQGRLIRPFGDGVSWSPSGDRLAYVSGDGVYVVREADGRRDRVADSRPGWAEDAGPVWTSNGQALVFADGELWRIPLEGGSGPEPIATLDGRTIHAVVTGTDRVPARTVGGEWLVRVGDDDTGGTGFARVDPSTGTQTAERLQPGRMGASLRLAATADGSRVVVSYGNATQAPELWLLGSDLAPARQISRMNPAFDSVALGETRQVTWTTQTGETVHGTVTLPRSFQGDAPVPLLVEVYGGSRGGASPGAFDRYRQLFATHGYAVFVPGIPLEVGTPMRGHADAVVPGLDRLIEDGIADPERLGVFGHSYGGYGTLALLVQTDCFSAAMAAAAQGNMVGAFGQLSADGTGRTRWALSGQGRMGTTPWDDPQRYIENSPLFYLDRIRAPLLLLHGTEDQAVPLHLAGEIFVGLQHLGRTVTLARYAGERHAWRAWRTPNKMDYWQRTLDWFDEHLGRGGPERQ